MARAFQPSRGICKLITHSYQIRAKSNNPWRSYSDLKVENLVAVRHLGLDRKCILSIWSFRGPTLHPHTRFQQNPTTPGWVIYDATKFPGTFFPGGAVFAGLILRVGLTDLKQIKGGHKKFIVVLKIGLVSWYVVPFRNQNTSMATGGWKTRPNFTFHLPVKLEQRWVKCLVYKSR